MQTKELRHIAIDVGRRIALRNEVVGVAVTGSVARGDCVAGSDVDLWVIGRRGGRETFEHHGTSVTLLWQPQRTLKDLDTLMRFEIEDAWILYDPKTLLRKVRMFYLEHRDKVREFMLHGTAQVIHELILRALDSDNHTAIAALREAARRSAAMHIYLKLGWRAPHWRHFENHLSGKALYGLSQILSLPHENSWRRLLRFYRRHGDALEPLQREKKIYPPQLPSATKLKYMSRMKRRADAWLSLRSSLQDLPDQTSPSSAAQGLWLLAQGFDQAPACARQRRRVARQVAAFIRILKIEDSLHPNWALRDLLLQVAAR